MNSSTIARLLPHFPSAEAESYVLRKEGIGGRLQYDLICNG
jgi:hypothetical protein